MRKLTEENIDLTNAELVYLWVDKYKNIEKQGFNFSQKYVFSYDEEKQEIAVKEHETLENFFGENLNITAIAGENGCGKSSVLRLLEFSINKQPIINDPICSENTKVLAVFLLKNKMYLCDSVYDSQFKQFIEVKFVNFNKIGVYNISEFELAKNYKPFSSAGIINSINSQDYFTQIKFLVSVFKYNKNAFDFMEKYKDFHPDCFTWELSDDLYNKWCCFKYDNQNISNLKFICKENIKITINILFKKIFGEKSINFNDFLLLENIHIINIAWALKNDFNKLTDVFLKELEVFEVSSTKIVDNLKMFVNFLNQKINEFLKKDFSAFYLKNTEFDDSIKKIEKLIKFYSNKKDQENIFNEYFSKYSGVFALKNEKAIDISKFKDSNITGKLEEVKISDYKDFNNLQNVVGILPEVFEESLVVDLVNSKKDNCRFSSFSSGEKSMLLKLAEVYFNLKANNLILLDEVDAYWHPEWQRNFVYYLTEIVKKFHSTEQLYEQKKSLFEKNNPDSRVQIIIATHSPFILSDLPRENVMLLHKCKNNHCKVGNYNKDSCNFKDACTVKCENVENINETFGANIHSLLSHSFFMKSTIGEFAKRKIEDWIEGIEKGEDLSSEIDKIGEPVLKNKLKTMMKYNDMDELKEKNKKSMDKLKEKNENLEKENQKLKKELENVKN